MATMLAKGQTGARDPDSKERQVEVDKETTKRRAKGRERKEYIPPLQSTMDGREEGEEVQTKRMKSMLAMEID